MYFFRFDEPAESEIVPSAESKIGCGAYHGDVAHFSVPCREDVEIIPARIVIDDGYGVRGFNGPDDRIDARNRFFVSVPIEDDDVKHGFLLR